MKTSPSAGAEQKEDGTDVAAAARGIEWGNGTLGALGVSGCAYKELGGSGWPSGSTCHGGDGCERGEKLPWKGDDPADTARWGLA